MRHKKEHHKEHSGKFNHKKAAKEHSILIKSHTNLMKMHESKAAEETKTKRALGQITGGQLKSKPHTARRVGEGVKGEEHPVREKRAYNKRKK